MMQLSKVKIDFFGKARGQGGYSYATRYIARAFAGSRVPVQFKTDNAFYKDLSTHSGISNVDFYIQTPPFSRHKSSNYKIGYFYWETDRLPVAWERDICRSLDEIWVPCQLTKQACRKAGFRGPIEVVFTPRPEEISSSPVAIPTQGSDRFVINNDTFIFYSIFQWNERKGYRKLFRAYMEEFSKEEKVLLVVKTNPIKHRDHGLSKIRHDSLAFKRFSKNNRHAPIYMITESLSEEELAGLHDIGSCFVLPHHGEGWGMPIHDAMMHDSLIITTKYGGITEHLDSSNSLIIKHKLTEVRPMNWNPYYQTSQNWADPDIGHLKSLMRRAYNLDPADMAEKTRKSRRAAQSMDIKSFSNRIESIFSQNRFKRY